jgi:hypothetical protein
MSDIFSQFLALVAHGVITVGVAIALFIMYGIPNFVITGVPSLLLIAVTVSGGYFAIRRLLRRQLGYALAALLFASFPLVLFLIDKTHWAGEASERRRTVSSMQYAPLVDNRPSILIVHGRMFNFEVAELLNRGPFKEVWVDFIPRATYQYEWTAEKIGCAERGLPSREAAQMCVRMTPAWRPRSVVPNATVELFIDERSTLLPKRPQGMGRQRLELRAVTEPGSQLIKYWEAEDIHRPVFPYLASWTGFVHHRLIYKKSDAVSFVLSELK